MICCCLLLPWSILAWLRLLCSSRATAPESSYLSRRWKHPSSLSPKLSLYPTVLEVRVEEMLSSSISPLGGEVFLHCLARLSTDAAIEVLGFVCCFGDCIEVLDVATDVIGVSVSSP